MGSGASTKRRPKKDEGSKKSTIITEPNVTISVEGKKIVYMLSTLGKTELQDKVVASVKSGLSGLDLDPTGLISISVAEDIIDTALKEHMTEDTERTNMKTNIMDGVKLAVDAESMIDRDELIYAIGKMMSRYTTRHFAKEKFEELDVDHSGYLEGKEIGQVATWVLTMGGRYDRSLPDEQEEEARQLLLQRIDADSDNKVSFEEFLALFEEEQRRGLAISYAKKKFKELDKDGSGFLEKEEINLVVDWLLDINGEHIAASGITRDDIKYNLIDFSDRDGKIPLELFVDVCDTAIERLEIRRRATEKFRMLDVDKSGFLDNEELQKVVDFMYHNLGFGKTRHREAAKRDLMARVDMNRDGKLDCDEFIALFHSVYRETNKPLASIDLDPPAESPEQQQGQGQITEKSEPVSETA